MSVIDVIIIIIFSINMANGYRRGLIRSIFSFLSLAIALALSNAIYPRVNEFLRNNHIVYDSLQEWIRTTLNLGDVIGAETTKAQVDLINSLNLPKFITDQLLTNNNPELYKFFNVTKIEDYIVGYIANYVMSIATWVLVFFITYLLMKMISRSLNIFSKLPVISIINRLSGAALSVIVSVAFIWICFTILTVFFLKPEYMWIFDMINASVIAKPLYDHNIILNLMGI